MQKALKSLQKKKKAVKILPADKGNATVVLSKQQYDDKILEHLSLSAYKKHFLTGRSRAHGVTTHSHIS